MRPTVEYLTAKFDEFNALCFGSQLPKVPIRLSKARTYLGQLGFKRRRRLFGTAENYGFVLRISVRLDLPEKEVEDTLLHEMIHLYIHSRQLKDSSAHGPLFRQLKDDINRHFARNITISRRRTTAEQNQDTQQRAHMVCVSTLDSGERGITVAAKSRVFQLWDLIPAIPTVRKTAWFLSYDPFFNRFPRALTPKVYRIEPDELDLGLKNATPLVRQGGRIYRGKAAD